NTYGYYSSSWDLCRLICECSEYFNKLEIKNDGLIRAAVRISSESVSELIDWNIKDADKAKNAGQIDYLYYLESAIVEWISFWANYRFFDSKKEKQESYRALINGRQGTNKKKPDTERFVREALEGMEDTSAMLSLYEMEDFRKTYRQKFYMAYSKFMYEYGEYRIALWLLKNAIKDLGGPDMAYDRDIPPDDIFLQIENFKMIMDIAAKTGDKKLYVAVNNQLTVHFYMTLYEYVPDEKYVEICKDLEAQKIELGFEESPFGATERAYDYLQKWCEL
nr:hypothetical protein [Lachnospiraceae bacterium]